MGESTITISRPKVMGVLNVTPDSFSDGGAFQEATKAIDHACRMVEWGADLIDVGGESTRPGAQPVPLDEELERVLPVVEVLSQKKIPVSIDTSKARVAEFAIDAGARFVNDVTAFSDPEMASVCASGEVDVCLMHMKGTPRTMQQAPEYNDVVAEIKSFLLSRAAYAESYGIQSDKIWLDPGIGFGKTTHHNLHILAETAAFASLPYPLLIGVSRKAFIGRLIGAEDLPAPVARRISGSLAAQIWAWERGARMIRTHDVAELCDFLRIRRAIQEFADYTSG